MKKLQHYLVVVLSTVLLFGCGGDSTEETPNIIEDNVIPPLVTSILSIDAGNKMTSEDIYVELAVNDNDLEEIRLFLVPTINSSEFTNEFVSTIDNTKYSKIEPNGETEFKITLQNIKDVNGAVIKTNSEYLLKLVLIKNSNQYISARESKITLVNQHPLIGSYAGIWNDNIYTNFAVSMVIDESTSTHLNGVLFYSPNFQPCCNAAQVGAENDGTVSFEFSNEEKKFSSYVFNQVLLTYMGGCNGTYNGDGSHEILTISINYEGQDCDGFHTGGNIEFTRVIE
jgi:hypothetical protein